MDLFKIFFNADYDIEILFSKFLVLFIAVAIIAWIIISKYIGRGTGKVYEIDEAEIGIGKQKIKFKPKYEDVQIAYKLWVELSTRKIGLPIDFDNDVIIEIYNSWYEFFKLTRELIKDIPISKIRKSESTQQLVNIAIAVLNEGLRPHLTIWQAKFRRWYQIKSENKTILSPQDLQKDFPEYRQLMEGIREVNQKLMKYREVLSKVAMGK